MQDYVNIRVFLSLVEELKSKRSEDVDEATVDENSNEERENKDDEVLEQNVD